MESLMALQSHWQHPTRVVDWLERALPVNVGLLQMCLEYCFLGGWLMVTDLEGQSSMVLAVRLRVLEKHPLKFLDPQLDQDQV